MISIYVTRTSNSGTSAVRGTIAFKHPFDNSNPLLYVSPMRVKADTRRKNAKADVGARTDRKGHERYVGASSGENWVQQFEALERTVRAVSNLRNLDAVL